MKACHSAIHRPTCNFCHKVPVLAARIWKHFMLSSESTVPTTAMAPPYLVFSTHHVIDGIKWEEGIFWIA